MSDFSLGALSEHAKVGKSDKPTQQGHTSDLPLEAVDQDITVTVASRHTGRYSERGRPIATYQASYRIGEHTPPDYTPTREEVEYMARAMEFCARRLREHYGYAEPAT
jgi:hypothetical protein